MTEIKFFKSKRGWWGFQARGHAGYADFGEDVVCAAVSALTQTAALGLKKVLAIDCRLEVNAETGSMLCLLPSGLAREKWDQAQLILTVFYAGLVDISTNKEYQRYVNLKEVSYRED